MAEYRPLPADAAPEFRRITRYAFHAEDGPPDEDGETTELGDRYGLFADGRLRSVARHYTFDARLRGAWIALGGLGGVATPPEYRGRGFARRAVRGAVEQFAAADVPLVTLWPFETAFYRQLGWASAHTVTRYECSPAALRDLGDGHGDFTPIGPDDWERCRTVHSAATAGETLAIRRSQAWWRQRVFRDWGDDRRYAVLLERDGEPAGYLAYDVERSGEDRQLDVAALAASDHAAFREVLGFLGRHGAQVGTVTLERGPGADLLEFVPEPEAITCTVEPGPMVRVTDVEAALSTTSVPATTGQVTLAVDDPLLDADDRVSLSVDGGRTTVDPAPEATPDVTLGIGALSALVVGAQSAATLAERGDLAAADPTDIDTLATLFPPECVYHREFY